MLENPMVNCWSGIFPGKLYSAFLWVVGVIFNDNDPNVFGGGSGHLSCCW